MAVSSHQAHPFPGINLHTGIVKQYLICESFGYGFYIQHLFLLLRLPSGDKVPTHIILKMAILSSKV
jgi:hypothetical protein